ncbi:MinD/ParA family protein [Ureibacillus endophyticus]|uniref:MinD/ParA family protein n=1 Tax=Ureibacillus endophyticus TaxID=1978490 RepID=A0A494ZAT2_9BACL|nr:MinD/ParA family protein [Lysinibacillus endophyticus]RKQ19812.1 MinD/ParA family protein [Lysinibacillus endophyticus]
MRDQAEKLRMKMLQSQGSLGRSIAVVSGKGGVGKSNFSTNFAINLSLQGKKVVILDMDIGMGNVHILIGKTTQFSFKDYLMGEATLNEVMYEGPSNLKYIPGGSGLTSVMEWTKQMFDSLIIAFEELQKSFDYILFDMGAGAANWSLDLLTSIDEIIVISTAEPTSITDAYSMMKFIHLKDQSKKFYLLCNRAYSKEEGQETLQRLQNTMAKFLNKEVTILGSLPEDPVVRKAVREQVPFSIAYPDSPIAKTLKEIVIQFINNDEIKVIHAPVQSNSFLSKLRSIFSKGRV